MKSVKEVSVENKRVLVRVDFNVPIKDGVVVDDFRIRAVLPTIRFLIKNKAIVILLSHLGRPKGKVVPELRLDPVADRLGELLQKKIVKTRDCVSLDTVKIVSDASPGDVVLLENLRFNSGEEDNNLGFAEKLAQLGDVFVNDAFSVCHRRHASVVGIPKFLPSFAGFELVKEVAELSKLLSPKKPFVVVLGGVKIETKLGVIKNLIDKVDFVLVGGAMVFTFFKALGLEVGKSIVEDDKINVAKEILDLGKGKLVFPVDIVVAENCESSSRIVSFNEIPESLAGFDIGPDACSEFSQVISDAGTVFWNGPMGLFEKKPFDKGTERIAKAIAGCKGFTVAGGGETVSAIRRFNLDRKFSFISSGGGASLVFLSGKKLPGIDVLNS